MSLIDSTLGILFRWAGDSVTGAGKVINTAVEPGDALGVTYDHKAAIPICTGTYIATATTTTCVTGAGVLHTIVVGETAAGAITVYDNTAGSGTIIAVLKASIAEQTFTFDRKFTTGLTVVTAAASKITVTHAPAA